MILFVKMQGWYNSANGATLRGGWEPIRGDALDAMNWNDFRNANPGITGVWRKIVNMYDGVNPQGLLTAFKFAYALDTALMLDDTQEYGRLMTVFQTMEPADQKLIRWIRRMVHSGNTRRAGTKVRKETREAQRAHLYANPWFGSDPWAGISREGWYRGLNPFMGPRSARKKGDPLPNPYRSLGWIRVSRSSRKPKAVEAGGAAAAATAAAAAVQAVADGASPEQAVSEGAAAGQAAAQDTAMQIDNIGPGEEVIVDEPVSAAQKILTGGKPKVVGKRSKKMKGKGRNPYYTRYASKYKLPQADDGDISDFDVPPAAE